MGIYPIVGLNTDFVLSLELRGHLNDYGITNLMQARNLGLSHTNSSNWLSTRDLDLGGPWKEEWSCYTNGLSHGGIILLEQNERLLWMHNSINGDVNAHLAYDLVATSCPVPLSG